MLAISDTGCGVAEEHLNLIFEPFITTKARGRGLGIPICKKIIGARNGRMSMASKLREGTTVEITLPVENSRPAAQEISRRKGPWGCVFIVFGLKVAATSK
jgi:signal transduction histidine kinase